MKFIIECLTCNEKLVISGFENTEEYHKFSRIFHWGKTNAEFRNYHLDLKHHIYERIESN